MSDELETRFGHVSRGRTVSVRYEPTGSLLALDYKVAFSAETNTFDVILRRGGCFEGAYRCIERWIEAKAEQIDGINSVPGGHMDLRHEMAYWLLEKVYEQFRSDLGSAVADKVAWLERLRPDEGVFGEVTIEARTTSLTGFLAYLERADIEVRRGVLSSQTIALWKAIGLDVISSAG